MTWRSSITSNKAACVFAGARFISSIKIILEKIGPFLKSNSEVFISKIEVPKISLGIKSGVNCMRLKPTSKVFANSFAETVFATPGTPSIKECPLAKIEAISISIMLFCPTITLPISVLIWATPSFNSLKSIRFVKLTALFSGAFKLSFSGFMFVWSSILMRVKIFY